MDEPTSKNETNIDNLLVYARAINFLLDMERIFYGTIDDFLWDNFDSCLKATLVTESCFLANIDFWKTHNIKGYYISGNNTLQPKNIDHFAGTHEFSDTYKALLHVMRPPSRLLKYSDTPEPEPELYWKFPMVYLELPDGWKLKRDCGCGSGIGKQLGAFRVLKNDEAILITSYFN